MAAIINTYTSFLISFFLLSQTQTLTATHNAAAAAVFSFSFPSPAQNSTFPFAFIQQQEGKGKGAAETSNSTSVTNFNSNSSFINLVPASIVVYRTPFEFKFVGPNSGFSTYFSFDTSLTQQTNTSFSFFLTLSSIRLDLLDGPPPGIISVTFTSFTSNSSHSLLDVRVGGLLPDHRDVNTSIVNFNIKNGTSILHSWIDYDASRHRLRVWLSTTDPTMPQNPILSYQVDGFSDLISRHAMLVGFSFSSSGQAQNSTKFVPPAAPNCTLYQWSFVAHHGSPYLMHSEPLDPDKFLTRPTNNPSHHVIGRLPHPWGLVLALIFAAACGAMVTFFALFIWFSLCAHRPVAPVEYPVHPADNVVYEKIVLVGHKNVQNSK